MTDLDPPNARAWRRQRRRPHAPGAPPGLVAPSADARPSQLTVRRFGPETFEEHVTAAASELAAPRRPKLCTWIDVVGLADQSLIAQVGGLFHLHDLSLEDAVDPMQRGKVEHYDHYTFVVMQLLSMGDRVEAHQLSLFVGDQFVVTFQDTDHPALAPVRQRLRQSNGRIRARGSDYLAYAIIDSVIDHYFPVVEAFDDRLERVEEAVLEAKSVDPIALARRARQDLRTIRHAVWPARNAVSALLSEDAPRITDVTRMHLRDCKDHLTQLQEMVEASREIATSLLEAYISRVGLRTNEVMKVLTVIATIFIPLTFITSLYGMNFNRDASPLNMPELDWYFGYPAVLGVMLVVAVATLAYFRNKGWLGDGASKDEPPDEP